MLEDLRSRLLLRQAKRTRDPMIWAKNIVKALDLVGPKLSVRDLEVIISEARKAPGVPDEVRAWLVVELRQRLNANPVKILLDKYFSERA